ncbi:MAG: hypothetical protein RLZZ292_1790 [Bacteroidota bacterium]
MEKNIKLATDTDVLIDAFSLKKIRHQAAITAWTSATGELTPTQKILLEDIYQNSFNRVGGWNEEEVKMKLISFLFYIAQIEVVDKISTFFERDMAADIDNKRLSVTCDCLVATPLGLSSPKLPYFFLQEFKRRKRTQNDPEGQMLAAMLIAQHQNNDNKPVYGAWITGSFWEFAILEGKNYHASRSFDTVSYEDLLQIVFILRKLKTLILER